MNVNECNSASNYKREANVTRKLHVNVHAYVLNMRLTFV